MRTKLVLSTITLALAGLTFTACGGTTGDDTSTGPDISAATATATDNGDGTFNIDINATYDDDVDVSSYTLDCTNGADATDDFDIPGPDGNGVISGATASGTLDLSVTDIPDTSTGSFSCNFALVDDNNLTSATFDFTFELD